MKPVTHQFSRATVGLVAVLLVAATVTVGMGMAASGPGDDPSAVSTVDRLQQVDDDESTDPETTPASDGLTRSDERITYSTPAGAAFAVENLTVSETGEEDVVSVSAQLTNPNEWPAIQHVVFRIDGEVIEREPFALQPNETDMVSYTVDTAEWTEGDHHVAVLSYDHGEVLTVSAEEPVEEPVNASVTFQDQESDGMNVTVEEVTVPDGGFVVLHETSSLEAGDAFGSTIGVSAYLDPGTHENVSVSLFDVPGADFERTELASDTELTAMAHLDSNANQTFDFVSQAGAEDGPYTIDGSAVVDTAMVSVESEPPVNETTTEPPANETTTESPANETTTETPVNDTTTEGDS